MVLFKKDDILAIKAMIIFKEYRLLEPVFPDQTQSQSETHATGSIFPRHISNLCMKQRNMYT